MPVQLDGVPKIPRNGDIGLGNKIKDRVKVRVRVL